MRFSFRAILIAIASVSLFVACEKYDDSALVARMDKAEADIKELQTLVNQLNSTLSGLATTVDALKTQDRIVSVTELADKSGWVVEFSQTGKITIYNGKNGIDGKDGTNGTDGTDGTNGQDGKTPTIGVKLDADGNYYWTVNGEFLLDENGNKIAATAHVATPQLRINNGNFEISYNGGVTWEVIGEAGNTGAVIFSKVEDGSDAVTFTLGDGTTIAIPKAGAFSITMDTDVIISAGESVNVTYSINSADDATVVDAFGTRGFEAEVIATSTSAGNVVITHTLASGSTGTATCLAKAEIYSDSACTNAVDTTTYGTFTEDAIKVNSKYIKSTSENYLKITLKTVLGDSTSFVEFQEKVQNTVNALTAGNDRLGILATVTVDTSGIDMYATITFPISALFTTTSGETEQTVKNLPFYSLSNQKNYAHTKILYSPDRSVSGGIDEAITTYGAEAVLSAFTRDYYQPGNVDWTSASGYDKTVVTGLNTKVQAYMTSGGNNVTELDFKANDVITLNAVDTSSEYQPRYSFVGWFVQKTDGTIEKLSNSSYTAAAADEDLVFIAVFEPVLTYVLQYTYDSTHYGSQSYLVKGVFTTQEIEKYL